MPEPIVPSPFHAWETFYVIIGSSAAALTGLQFVVMALVAETRVRKSGSAIAAFATPTIVHFSAVLWMSAVLSAPWNRMSLAALVIAISGAIGVGYGVVVFLRARGDTGYEPVLEDWLWHNALPMVAYVTVLSAGLGLVGHVAGALFALAAAALLLLFVGIHNAWDTATYMALQNVGPATEPEEPREARPEAPAE